MPRTFKINLYQTDKLIETCILNRYPSLFERQDYEIDLINYLNRLLGFHILRTKKNYTKQLHNLLTYLKISMSILIVSVNFL